jgi:CBS domain-containing protein
MITQGIPGRVQDLMTRDPLVIDQDAPLADAAELMDTFEITGLPVIDADGRLAGVLSQTDVVRAATTQHLWHAWPGLAVRHLMTSPAIWVRGDCSLEDAARLMERERVHRVVVVGDDESTPIGILTMSDFVRLIAEAADHA